jgi:hypothetical protein
VTTDNPLGPLLAEITYHYKLGQLVGDAADNEEARAARWDHLIATVHLLRELRSRVEADGGIYDLLIERLMRAAKEFDPSISKGVDLTRGAPNGQNPARRAEPAQSRHSKC